VRPTGFTVTKDDCGRYELGVALSHEEYVFIEPGIRFITVDPYIVFYRIGAADVVVLRILHSRRDALGELLG
jgi:toxin ParE1/3/4